MAHLVIEGYVGGFIMMLEPGEEYTATLTRDGVGDIHGGKLQEDFNEYQQTVADANTASRTLQKKVEEAAAKKHFKTTKELEDKVDKVQENAFAKMNALIRKNADNVFAAYLQTAGSERIMELKPLKEIYALLSDKAKETAPGKILAERIADLEKVSIAATAPDFTLTTPEGKQVSLYSVKGKLKIIDFWASWCGPCRMENPNMVKLYNDFKDKGLAIISVSLDERKAPWMQAIKKDSMPWTHVSSLKGWKCDVVKQYKIDAVPSIIVLDENNRILARNIRAEKLRAFVTEYLK
ncbi:MAG: TlpA family protein disulfide reductase [Odoribacter splanchnicus]